jgi:farnesyl diphosphate synthase
LGTRYRVPAVGNIAINDGLMLEASIYYLIKKHLRSDPAYVDYLELFLEVRTLVLDSCSGSFADFGFESQTTFQTELGQLVDLLTAPEDDVNLDRFSLKK